MNGRLKVLPDRRRRGHPRRRRRGGGGRLGRPLPRRRLPDRLGHVVEHERQRGDRRAGVGAARAAGAPQRRGQRLAVVERRVPVGHPPRRHAGASRSSWCRPSSTWPRRCAASSAAFKGVVKAGRTHLMDATPVTLGQEFGGLRRADRARRSSGCGDVCRASASCPSAARPSAPASTRRRASPVVSSPGSPTELDLPLTEARDHFEAQGARDALVEASGTCRVVAVSLNKIANDLRWMSSGPRCGLAEIHLPDLQPGSSIMPGKVNPVVPEAVHQVVAQVIGNDAAVGVRGLARQLRAERDAAGHRPQPARVDPLLASVSRAARRQVHRRASRPTWSGAGPTPSRRRPSARRSTPTSATRPPARVIKRAVAEGRTLREVVLEEGLLPEDRGRPRPRRDGHDQGRHRGSKAGRRGRRRRRGAPMRFSAANVAPAPRTRPRTSRGRGSARSAAVARRRQTRAALPS